MKRSKGERIRIRHDIERFRDTLKAVELAVEDTDNPPGPDVAQALAHAGVDIACSIARLEAYCRAEKEQEKEAEQYQQLAAVARAITGLRDPKAAAEALYVKVPMIQTTERLREERDEVRKSEAYWQEEARRYAQNADHHRAEVERLKEHLEVLDIKHKAASQGFKICLDEVERLKTEAAYMESVRASLAAQLKGAAQVITDCWPHLAHMTDIGEAIRAICTEAKR